MNNLVRKYKIYKLTGEINIHSIEADVILFMLNNLSGLKKFRTVVCPNDIFYFKETKCILQYNFDKKFLIVLNRDFLEKLSVHNYSEISLLLQMIIKDLYEIDNITFVPTIKNQWEMIEKLYISKYKK